MLVERPHELHDLLFRLIVAEGALQPVDAGDSTARLEDARHLAEEGRLVGEVADR